MSEVLMNVGKVEGQGIVEDILDPKNYAQDNARRERWREEVWECYHEAKDRRSQLNEDWRRYYDIWKGVHTLKYYDGEADLKLRMVRKVIDTLVSQTKGLIWPENQFYMVQSNGPEAEQQVARIKALIDHDIEQSNLKNLSEMFLTTGFVYGHAVLKTWWHTESISNLRRSVTSGGQVTFQPRRIYTYEGPKTKVMDPARLYIWPMTARGIEEATAIYEDMEVSKSFLLSHSKGSNPVYDPKAVKEVLAGHSGMFRGDTDIDDQRDARVASDGYTVSEVQAVKDLRFRLTEIWCRFALHGDEEQWCKATMVNGILVELRQTPFFFGGHPYDMWTVTDLMDNVYGQSKVSQVEDLQYAMDAMLNQYIDTLNYQINPIILVDEDAVAMESIKIAPRALWRVQGSQKNVTHSVSQLRPPDMASAALQGMGTVMGLVQDLGNAPPITQGKTGSKEITATEASVLAQGASTFTSTMASKIENQVLSPLLRRYYMLEEQFRSADSLARIAGVLPTPVDPQDVVGDYQFRWHVSSQAAQALQHQQVMDGSEGRGAGGGDQAAILASLIGGGNGEDGS